METIPIIRNGYPGRHHNHYLWLLTQSYSDIPRNLRRLSRDLPIWYPKERTDLKMIHYENRVLTDDELVIVRGLLEKSKHACLHL